MRYIAKEVKMVYVIIGLALIFIGWVFCYSWMLISRHGTLYFDISDPKKDSYLFDLDIELEEIPEHKWLIVNVRKKNNSLDET